MQPIIFHLLYLSQTVKKGHEINIKTRACQKAIKNALTRWLWQHLQRKH